MFKDLRGREWLLEITLGTAMRLKSAGVSFYALAENRCEKFFALRTDDEAFAAILWAICKPQAESRGVTEADFYDALAGAAFDAAWEAFASAYVNFTRNPEIRSAMKAGLEAMKRQEQAIQAKVQERCRRLEEMAAKQLDAKMGAEMSDAHLEAMLTQSSPQPISSESSGGSSAS